MFDDAAFAELLERVRASGLPPITALSAERAVFDSAAADAEKRKKAFMSTGGELGPPPQEFYPLSSAMAAELVATQQQFDQVEAAVLLHKLLADPRNFDKVLTTFETGM